MAKILYVKANPKTDEESNTFKLANVFVEEYKRLHPNDEIKTLDLYQAGIKMLDGEMLNKMFSNQDNEALEYAKDFVTYDKYIIAAPMWNLSIPAILKAYLDYIVYVGVSFKYTEQGPVGLLENKKLLHVVTRGGFYSEGDAKEFEMGDRYIRTISHFIGIEHIKTLKLELTNVLPPEQLKEAQQEAYEEARRLAEEF